MQKRFAAVLVFVGGFLFGQLEKPSLPPVELLVLGTLQDGGSPHMGCWKSCCAALYDNPDPNRKVVSLGLLDNVESKTYLLEATPDLPSQMGLLLREAPFKTSSAPDGIFLTHAHIGHYTGLMFLGREAMNASGVPVYALPRMLGFLKENGPWDQLVRLGNIQLNPASVEIPVKLSDHLEITPFQVPHRDEYSETAGYRITGPSKTAIFIPDIDKWDRWDISLQKILEEVDLAFLDATFYNAAEIGYRDMSEIPHPFVVESISLLENLPARLRNKVYFIHLNHTNPLLDAESEESRLVGRSGFRIARIGDRFKL
jgi:pyrroloquinoline quinone biosynthesis protein B